MSSCRDHNGGRSRMALALCANDQARLQSRGPAHCAWDACADSGRARADANFSGPSLALTLLGRGRFGIRRHASRANPTDSRREHRLRPACFDFSGRARDGEHAALHGCSWAFHKSARRDGPKPRPAAKRVARTVLEPGGAHLKTSSTAAAAAAAATLLDDRKLFVWRTFGSRGSRADSQNTQSEHTVRRHTVRAHSQSTQWIFLLTKKIKTDVYIYRNSSRGAVSS
mmetsp:Transcript_23293/g.58158  ORF Transcript_23293/g.58158 Transcript_23293/m.58158 type:complete len:227 (+) Transcript_23293:534-1214(+)